MVIPIYYGNIKAMFQTTNQYIILPPQARFLLEGPTWCLIINGMPLPFRTEALCSSVPFSSHELSGVWGRPSTRQCPGGLWMSLAEVLILQTRSFRMFLGTTWKNMEKQKESCEHALPHQWNHMIKQLAGSSQILLVTPAIPVPKTLLNRQELVSGI